jgi:RNA polymerase sigma factor (sigma-70 family)
MNADAPPSGLAEFAAREGQNLLRYAYLLTGRHEDAEDLVQTVLLQLSGRDLAALSNPGAYARRAITNLHRSLGRRTTAHLRALTRTGEPPGQRAGRASATDPRTSDAAHAIDERDALWRALNELSVRQRAAVVLRYYEDRNDQQIGDVLGCAPGTVRSLISRALPRLRDHLAPDTVSSAEGDPHA